MASLSLPFVHHTVVPFVLPNRAPIDVKGGHTRCTDSRPQLCALCSVQSHIMACTRMSVEHMPMLLFVCRLVLRLSTYSVVCCSILLLARSTSSSSVFWQSSLSAMRLKIQQKGTSWYLYDANWDMRASGSPLLFLRPFLFNTHLNIQLAFIKTHTGFSILQTISKSPRALSTTASSNRFRSRSRPLIFCGMAPAFCGMEVRMRVRRAAGVTSVPAPRLPDKHGQTRASWRVYRTTNGEGGVYFL